jgi:hypothetical protein
MAYLPWECMAFLPWGCMAFLPWECMAFFPWECIAFPPWSALRRRSIGLSFAVLLCFARRQSTMDWAADVPAAKDKQDRN